MTSGTLALIDSELFITWIDPYKLNHCMNTAKQDLLATTWWMLLICRIMSLLHMPFY